MGRYAYCCIGLTLPSGIKYSQYVRFGREEVVMPHLGTTELIVILVIVVILFGVNKIPQLGKGLGEGIKNFKSSLKEGQQESDSEKTGKS
jgi:sec-independent protein translocase protein TatA